MMWSRERGQALPMLCILLLPLLLFIGANLDRSLGGVNKISNQRKVDTTVLILANEQARALNAIAALNQALRIALERGYAVGVALLALEACSMAIISAPYCAPALSRLGAKAVPFFRKLVKLGDELARMQDQIISWASKRPSRMVFYLNHPPSQGHESQFVLFPNESELPVAREGFDSYAGMEAKDGEVGFAHGEDLTKCHRSFFENYFQFSQARENRRIRLGKNDSLKVDYVDLETGFQKEVMITSLLDLAAVRRRRPPYDFQNATYLRCQSLTDLLSSFGFRGLIKIPSPYQLKSSFFEKENRLAVARAQKRSREINPLLRHWEEKITHRDRWAISEAEVGGGDLSTMEFHPTLRRVSLDKELWERVQQEIPRLFMLGFNPPPIWRNEREGLAH